MTKEIHITDLLRPGVLESPELLTYDTFIQEKRVGTFTLETRDIETDTWEFYSEYEDQNGLFITSQTRLRKKDLKPLLTNKDINNQQGRFTISACYVEDKVKMTAVTPTGQQSLELPLSDMTFDNEAVLMILRTLKWQEGLDSCLEGIIVDNGQKYFAWVKILRKEKINCGLGEMDSWHVKLSFDSGTTQDLWYGVEHPHFLIKYKNSYFMLVLRGVD